MNTTEKGDALEIAVFNLFEAQIETDRFFARKDCCRIFRRKGYYSEKRKANIIFDISIEISFPGAPNYSMLILIECKNYAKTVPVDDVEEFFAKVEQAGVANTKGIFVSNSALQSSALNYCKSQGMGVARYFDGQDLKWELQRSASASFAGHSAGSALEAYLGLTRPEYRSSVFELYMHSPHGATNSLNTFFEDLVFHGLAKNAPLHRLPRSRAKRSDMVPYLKLEELENIAHEALTTIGTNADIEPVDLEQLCAHHPAAKGLKLIRTTAELDSSLNHPLARITFEPLVIELFELPGSSSGRNRFTLAHEIGHLLLGHGKYLKAEWRNESDNENIEGFQDDGTALRRMEVQANYVASCLLMPRALVSKAFYEQIQIRGIQNKGFGLLFVDSQECNLNNYYSVTSQLMMQFGVSRAAVTIRLAGMGLIKDARKKQTATPLIEALNRLTKIEVNLD
ncbi:ImmA/IrrE family metallo-endopeptidase [Acidovorax sp. NCPPB 4044]|uniref:ImmA/IrrE family metallo-endopeptidase n=1 Tax=Acidovorax sp. NCPPB 4044 TaxID=2940490 RepID=UPI0023033052|nr:ImmA/IrrE family metallo-endopeptidase [Acidovorax sp. NCPPB 4044]MDA8519866.1 ImmA/IrrE family metallo-endopeptidase [Acidovorax sp. NCPPB 4044]